MAKSTSKRHTVPSNGSAKVDDQALGDELRDRDPLEVRYKDFFWTYTEEPHRTRRLAIIKAHPEVPYSSCSKSLG
jgi:sphingolipid 4-desaturase/C4-monooxygenase